MKIKILLIITLFFSSDAFCQNVPKYGFRAGIISSGIRGDASGNFNQLIDKTNGYLQTSDRTGFFAGVNTNIPITENFSIEPGLYYTQKGYDLTGNLDIKGIEFLGVKAKAALQTQYIDVPVLFKGNFGGLQIFAGPQVSYLAQANLKTTAGVLGINILNKSIDASGQFNRWDAALTAGVGYQFANGINIMAAYDYGIMKMDANQNVNAFNRAIKVGIGINF
ncbi:MAG: porin family protein [Ginsengibacter sp.]